MTNCGLSSQHPRLWAHKAPQTHFTSHSVLPHVSTLSAHPALTLCITLCHGYFVPATTSYTMVLEHKRFAINHAVYRPLGGSITEHRHMSGASFLDTESVVTPTPYPTFNLSFHSDHHYPLYHLFSFITLPYRSVHLKAQRSPHVAVCAPDFHCPHAEINVVPSIHSCFPRITWPQGDGGGARPRYMIPH